MKDCGTIVFNEDEEWCYKVMPYWNGTGFVTEDGEPFDVLESLTDDLYFFSSADCLLPAKTGFVHLGDERYADTDGPLYLRCDRGNPGEVFDSIEFCISSKRSSGLVDMAKGCLVDNLCIKYTSDSGVMPGDAEGNDVIQNCEIAWCGGVWAYDEGGRVVTGGDGFSLITGITIRDCYIHHNYDNGITIECGSDPGRVVADVTAVGNLIDYNGGGIQIICFDEDMVSHNIMFRDFLIEDNYILHSGESWAAAVQLVTREAPTDDLAAGHSIRLGDLNIRLYAPNTVFKNNVIYSESVCNIWGAFTGDAMPQFIDNQIYVRKDTMVALWSPDPDSDFLWYCIGDENYNSEVLFNQELGSGNIVGYFD